MKLLLKNGRVVDPSSGKDEISDILIDDGKIKVIAKGIDSNDFTLLTPENFQELYSNLKDFILDVADKVVAPGFIDMHTHLRSPGREDEETIEAKIFILSTDSQNKIIREIEGMSYKDIITKPVKEEEFL